MSAAWHSHRGAADSSAPRIVGVLNVTPDSFSDGGELPTAEHAARRARVMLDDGAHILDIGGESTRPGADAVSPEEQTRRVVPAIRAIRDAGIAAPISIDTTSAAVAQAALDAGANAINDVSGATDDAGMLALAAERGCGLVLMHRLTTPDDDVYSTDYTDAPDYGAPGVVHAVASYLRERADRAIEAGVGPGSIVLDPGLGFGKTVEQNYALIAHTGVIAALGIPELAASSRKSIIGAITGQEPPAARDDGSVAAAVAQVLAGADIVRCHDIAPHARALAVAHAARAQAAQTHPGAMETLGGRE